MIHFGLGGVFDEENKPPLVVEISPAIGWVAVLDVMPFMVLDSNIDARELTGQMLNRVSELLCLHRDSSGESGVELSLPKSQVRQKLNLEAGVKTALKDLGFDRDAVTHMTRGLRFAEFRTPEVLLLSLSATGREAGSKLPGLVAPAAASVVPVVIADIEPYQSGMAGGFQIFVQAKFAAEREYVIRLVSTMEDVLLEYNYRVRHSERAGVEFKDTRRNTRSDFKREDRAAVIQERQAQRISDEEARALEAELRAKGLLL